MDTSSNQVVTPAMRAEASAWIARLHGPKRDARTEAGFKSWLRANTAHTRAFEQTTEAWEAIGGVPAETLSTMVRWERVGRRRRLADRSVLAVAASVMLAVIGLLYHWYTAPVTTDIGEQRAVTLKDGTRVYLNTASRMHVRYDRDKRQIELEVGEALFEVAKETRRPFVVVVGDRQITALGTSFVVRRDPLRLAVTLVEGKVAVAPVEGASTVASHAPMETRTLTPGQRLTFAKNDAPLMDTPALAKITAWQRGLVILDGTRLADAAEEMNRYSAVALGVLNSQVAELRVSGAFRAGDSLSFAQAVARTYRLRVIEEKDRIVLDGVPRATYQ